MSAHARPDDESPVSALLANTAAPLLRDAWAGAMACGVGSPCARKRAGLEEIHRHGCRLAALSTALGRALALDAPALEDLRLGSLLHDIGKAALPVELLLKDGRLTAGEIAAIRCHPIIGDLLCAHVPGLERVRPIVRHHHERLDGSGYPDGLCGNAVPLLAQIVGVVDVYDALVYRRAYKPAYRREDAFSILHRETRLAWRRTDIVEALIDVVEREGTGIAAIASA
jgi:HD-GYP domain-containing protein (c-di-GMP phosphodiesterase class II)